MMRAQFKLTKHGWTCRKVWKHSSDRELIAVPMVNTIFMRVNVAPKTGFCKRPHFYL